MDPDFLVIILFCATAGILGFGLFGEVVDYFDRKKREKEATQT